MIFQTRSIVLCRIPFKENSFLVKLLTDNLGIISVIVQGARKTVSPFFSQFEIGNCLAVHIIKTRTSDLSILKDSVIIKCSDFSKCSYLQLLALQSATEIFSQIEIPEYESEIFYDLLLTYLDFLPSVKSNHLLIIWRFLLRLTELLGFPLAQKKDGRYIFYENYDALSNATIDGIERQIIDNWFNILPVAGKYIDAPNILNSSCILINKMIINWFATNLNKRINFKTLEMYEEYVLQKND